MPSTEIAADTRPRRRRPLPRNAPLKTRRPLSESSQHAVHSSPDPPSPDDGEPAPPASMSEDEAALWAMSFEDLFAHAREYYHTNRHEAHGAPRWKSGRVRIIKWLCEKQGIRQFVAPSRTPPVDAAPVDRRPAIRDTGAVSHPEAILRTSDPELQTRIELAEAAYRTWPAAALLDLAMRRSYQLLKDSSGKLPSKSVAALSAWLAAWDVLKSEREKKWWLGDGIDLVNKAKAIGYEGSSKKYHVILWLRNTPEEVDVEIGHVAEPTDNRAANHGSKRRAEGEAARTKSKRLAKGTVRPEGWQAVGPGLKLMRKGP